MLFIYNHWKINNYYYYLRSPWVLVVVSLAFAAIFPALAIAAIFPMRIEQLVAELLHHTD
jgi:hypothetical protein